MRTNERTEKKQANHKCNFASMNRATASTKNCMWGNFRWTKKELKMRITIVANIRVTISVS